MPHNRPSTASVNLPIKPSRPSAITAKLPSCLQHLYLSAVRAPPSFCFHFNPTHFFRFKWMIVDRVHNTTHNHLMNTCEIQDICHVHPWGIIIFYYLLYVFLPTTNGRGYMQSRNRTAGGLDAVSGLGFAETPHFPEGGLHFYRAIIVSVARGANASHYNMYERWKIW